MLRADFNESSCTAIRELDFPHSVAKFNISCFLYLKCVLITSTKHGSGFIIVSIIAHLILFVCISELYCADLDIPCGVPYDDWYPGSLKYGWSIKKNDIEEKENLDNQFKEFTPEKRKRGRPLGSVKKCIPSER